MILSTLKKCQTGICKSAQSEIGVDAKTPCIPAAGKTPDCDQAEIPFNATAFCQAKPVGRYEHPMEFNCKNYINCFAQNNILGQVYPCVGTTKFNPSKGLCVAKYACKKNQAVAA